MKLSSQQVLLHTVLLGHALAQTPPGYTPQTDGTVSASYGGLQVSNGMSIPLNDTAVPPTISLTNYTTSNTSHLLALLDLDAPGGIAGDNKTYSPLLHWMTYFPSANNGSSKDIAPYINPQPGVGTGMHRYMFLLYETPASAAAASFEMPASFQDFNASDLNQRFVFNISGFASEAGLSLVGANWFETQNTTGTVEIATVSAGGKVGMSGSFLPFVGLVGLFAFVL